MQKILIVGKKSLIIPTFCEKILRNLVYVTMKSGVTPGNMDDRTPVTEICQNIFGKLFGDKGYISKNLTDVLFKDGIQLITTVSKEYEEQIDANNR